VDEQGKLQYKKNDIRISEFRERFGEVFFPLEMGKEVVSSVVKLFFEKRVKYNGGCAGVLQTFHVVALFYMGAECLP
jgi:hypothetical protein